jgi:lipoprotein-anchoring transpeptidase ErfK/SrfK
VQPPDYVAPRPHNVVKKVPTAPTSGHPSALPPRRAAKPPSPKWLLPALIGVPALMSLFACAILGVGGLLLLGGGRALPGVSTAGIEVGGMSQPEAAAEIAAAWANRGVVLQDGERQIPVDPALLGIALDAEATAREAVQYGRSGGNLLSATFGSVDVEPVVSVAASAAVEGLTALLDQVETAPVNAGVQFVNGEVQPRAAINGRMLDVGATVAALERDPAALLADGALELVMFDVPPAVTDPTPILETARALLANPLQIRAYDPISDDVLRWSVLPDEWGGWIVAAQGAATASGISLSLDEAALRGYLSAREGDLGQGRYLRLDEATAEIQNAVARGQTDPYVRVYHEDRQHTVRAGETIISIAWDYGTPYPWIQAANPGVGDTLSVGQTITIPTPDNFLEFPVVYDKRIVVSIGEQRTRVYENGQLKWDWVSSTGIDDSPTWRGIYQVILHEPNAYAGNWNLYMPNFVGVYRPIPGSDFMNGFHGFPTRGTSQLLWTNSLGTRVTYGCILLDDENARLLYEWAEEGVVVEIRP